MPAWTLACRGAPGGPLRPPPTGGAWVAKVADKEAVPAATFAGDPLQAGWLPSEAIATLWMQYVKDTAVADGTPPPAPTNVRVSGNEITWEAEADLESGLAGFIIERDGEFLANYPEGAKNPFGRPLFQNLQYSDTPTQPLVPMRFTDPGAEAGQETWLQRHGREHRRSEVETRRQHGQMTAVIATGWRPVSSVCGYSVPPRSSIAAIAASFRKRRSGYRRA